MNWKCRFYVYMFHQLQRLDLQKTSLHLIKMGEMGDTRVEGKECIIIACEGGGRVWNRRLPNTVP